MSLTQYEKKRDLKRSPEPSGSSTHGENSLAFVVQKHNASHLHYDLRLEVGGVLKSWAVPKGPSMNPHDKHLAIMVEDHPLDYRSFEGVIPEGNYGAGVVQIWDRGTYCPEDICEREEAEKIATRQLEKGHLSFTLHGDKLRGRFALAKMKRSREENAWLLFKAEDEFASDEDIQSEDRSAASGRTMDEIGAESAATPASELDLGDAPEAPMPHKVSPMLATLVDEAFDSPDWFFEIKWDGYRAIAEIEAGNVRLYSRNDRAFNERFPSVVESLRKIGLDVVLDGEVVVLDEQGKSQFQLLQDYLSSRRGTLVYYVFDILHAQGRDLRALPLSRRKDILRAALPSLPNVKLSDHVEGKGTELFSLASQQDLEGIVAKKRESPYRAGVRGRDWLKIRAVHGQEFVIGGFTEPRGSRRYFGALLLGVYDNEELVFVGHVGTGLDAKGLARFREKLQPLERSTSPFANTPKTNAPAHWVDPVLVCEVKFHGWTEDALLRQPVIVGLREDKPAKEVRRETPEASPRPHGKFAEKPQPKEDKDVEILGRTLRLTNLNKVFWPDDKYTKGDLIAYYREVAKFILPHLRDRPESLNRHPDGIKGESFYQKNVPNDMTPDWMERVSVTSEDAKHGVVNYVLCQDEAALVFLANLGCIELNPWTSRLGSLDRPDFAVMDLDPLGVPFAEVVRTARAVREVLEGVEIRSFAKTSGATGLHIYVPLGAQYTFDQARDFMKIIAAIVNRRLPDTTSVERMPAKRQGKVYLDCLQNRHGQTLACAYSVRPQPRAPVSTPLRWDEVVPSLDPRRFTIRTTMDRLGEVGDLFEPVLGPGIDLGSVLERLSR